MKWNEDNLKLVIFDKAQKRTRPSDITSFTNVDEVCVGTNLQRFQACDSQQQHQRFISHSVRDTNIMYKPSQKNKTAYRVC